MSSFIKICKTSKYHNTRLPVEPKGMIRIFGITKRIKINVESISKIVSNQKYK